MADIEFEINGQKLTAQPGQTVIEVADAAGIYIPRFCYHKHLSIAANCRMCLVEVEKSPKALPACATPVMPGMKVFTKSQKTVAAQRAVMEFLLINHPLDCPICDQGGECELQDLSMGYGSGYSHYDEPKRSIADQDLGPLIATDMTRCIYCTRCVRFGDEIAGTREMGGTFRGENTEIGTYVQHYLKSEVSGNIIDLCPVGALTSKPYRFTARAWELQQSPGISPHDCVGSNLNIHTRYGEVKRVVTRENVEVNQTWIADRDRFSYEGLYHQDRIEKPLIKVDGQWQIVEWAKALEFAAKGLQEVIHEFGPDKLGSLASPNSTLEEFYLLQKITRALGSPHIDHRLRESDTRDQSHLNAPGLNLPLSELINCDAIILIGSNLQKEQPSIALRVREAALKGAKVIVINPIDYLFNFAIAAKAISSLEDMPSVLNEIVKGTDGDINQILQGKQNVCLLLGAFAMQAKNASTIRQASFNLATKLGASIGLLTDGANSAGGWIAGAIPHRQPNNVELNNIGLNSLEMVEKTRKAYVLMNVEPEFDCANPAATIHALEQAKFTVALSIYRNESLEKAADVILPMTPFTETSGTFVNVNGKWQSFNGVATPFGEARPAWKILRVLANFLGLDGFSYESAEQVKKEVASHLQNHTDKQYNYQPQANGASHHLYRLGEVPIYAVDSIVRRSEPLQAAQTIMLGNTAVIRMHPETAKKYALQDGEIACVKQQTSEVELPVILDERLAKNMVWLAGGIAATKHMGDLFGEVEVSKK